MKSECIVKTEFFSKNVIRESSAICIYECSRDLSLLTKWPVFYKTQLETIFWKESPINEHNTATNIFKNVSGSTFV